MAGIRDVAQKAGVGATTVSRFLNNSGYVSQESADKIKKAIDELQYTPNELARNLFHKKSGIVAILVPDVAHPFFGEFVRAAEMELYDCGFKTMICSTVQERKSEAAYVEMLERHIVDGIITGVHTVDAQVYLATDKPIVALDRILGGKIPDVHADHRLGGRLAAQCLLRAGCKNVLQFQGALSVQSTAHLRHETFCAVMQENGATVHTRQLEWNRFDQSYFKQVVHETLEKHPTIDGVFGADMLAMASMQEVLRHGKRVPRDVKVVAYDGTFVTDYAIPSMTAVMQPIRLLAETCVHILVERIEDPDELIGESVLPVRLVERTSTQPG